MIADLVEAVDSIRQYGSDTLSGRADGPDDWDWQREAVREMTARAHTALETLRQWGKATSRETDGLCRRAANAIAYTLCNGEPPGTVDDDDPGGVPGKYQEMIEANLAVALMDFRDSILRKAAAAG